MEIDRMITRGHGEPANAGAVTGGASEHGTEEPDAHTDNTQDNHIQPHISSESLVLYTEHRQSTSRVANHSTPSARRTFCHQ